MIKKSNRLIKKLTKTILGICGLLIVLYVAYLSKCSVIDKEITEGEYFGFKIGDSKNKCYQKARELYNKGKILGFEDIYYNGFSHYAPERELDITRDICLWQYWIISGISSQYKRIDIEFKDGILKSIENVIKNEYKELTSWQYDGDTQIVFSVGDSCIDIAGKFEELKRKGIKEIAPANLSKYKIPKRFNNTDYDKVADFIRFDFKVGKLCFVDDISLLFDNDGKLSRVKRYRFPVELP